MTKKKVSVSARAANAFKTAYRLVSSPDTWTTMTSARNGLGQSVSVHSPQAVKFCATGACFKARVPGYLEAALHDRARKLYPNRGNLVSVNDKDGRLAVVRVFKSVARAKKISLAKRAA